MKRYVISAVLAVLGCGGCSSSATYEYLMMDKSLKSIQEIDVIHIVNQKHIEAQFAPNKKAAMISMALVGGAVGYIAGSMVDTMMAERGSTSASRRATHRVVPYREKLSDYNAEKKGKEAIFTAFDQSGYLMGKYSTRYNVEPNSLDIGEYVDDFSERKLLTIKTEYSFAPDMDTVQVVSTGVLYLNPPKESRFSERRRKWETVVWSVQYQSPGRHVKYKAVEKRNIKIEMDKLKSYYDGRIKAARSSEKQNLKSVKKLEQDKFKKRKYVKHLDPIVRPDWDEHNLKSELDKGIALSIQELVRSLGDEGGRVKGDYEVVYMLPDTKGTPRNKMSLAVLERDVDGGHMICWAKDNQKYIIPNQELLQLPSPYRR